MFSCECDARKLAWIRDNFGKLKHLSGDVKELCSDKAHNYITETNTLVPAVDIVIAGFVCKSVSSENNDRGKYSNCINDVVGKTGETFKGVMDYVRRYNPAVVICENVEGLVKRNEGREPVINDVRASFINAGYAFDHKVPDTRHYLLPQRRRRCWMWAFYGPHHQGQAELAAMDVKEGKLFFTSRFVSWPFVFLGFSCFLVLSMLLVSVFRVSLFASVFLC